MAEASERLSALALMQLIYAKAATDFACATRLQGARSRFFCAITKRATSPAAFGLPIRRRCPSFAACWLKQRLFLTRKA
jgi:hypothetical protein